MKWINETLTRWRERINAAIAETAFDSNNRNDSMPRINDEDWRRVLDRLPELVHRRGDARESRLLRHIDSRFNQLETMIMATQAMIREKLNALVANVAELPTRIESVEKVLDNLGAMIKTLQEQVANADVPDDISDSVDSIGAAVTAGKQRILDDVAKNTKAEPGQPTPQPVGSV